MKQIHILIRVIVAIILITIGVDRINQPSNLDVGVGVALVIIAISIVYKPFISLFKKI